MCGSRCKNGDLGRFPSSPQHPEQTASLGAHPKGMEGAVEGFNRQIKESFGKNEWIQREPSSFQYLGLWGGVGREKIPSGNSPWSFFQEQERGSSQEGAGAGASPLHIKHAW